MVKDKRKRLQCGKCGKLFLESKIKEHFLQCTEISAVNISENTSKNTPKLVRPDNIPIKDWNTLTDYQKNTLSTYNPIKDKREITLARKGKAFYIGNRETMQITVKDISRIAPIVDVDSTGCRYALRKPYGTLDGLDLFWLEHENPVSLDVRFDDSDGEANTLTIMLPKASEIQASHRGAHLQRLARTNVMDFKTKLVVFLWSLLEASLIILFYTMYITTLGGK